MDALNHYRLIIQNVIKDFSQYKPSCGDVQIEVVFDEKNDHYELIHAGWNGPYRIHGSVIHIDIRDGKVWIQCDGVEEGVANVLVREGIPKEHIVLAFKPPEIRPYIDFAAA